MSYVGTVPSGLTPVEQTVYDVAVAEGVDPRLALADAQVESGLSPTAVGDQGTSFGLFQLHQGGELGSLSPAQAFDPYTNAQVALSEFAAVARSQPGLDPGALAAAAERPANPGAYATRVDAVYNNPSFLPQVPGGSSSGATGQTTGLLGPIGGAVSTVGGWIGDVLGFGGISKSVFEIALTIAFVIAGLGLILLGLTRIFPGVTRTITTTAGRAAVAAAA